MRKIRKYKRYLQGKNREVKKQGKLTKQQIEHRNDIYDTEDGIIETLKSIERYLPKEKRIYFNEYQKHNIKNDFGYILLENKNIKDIIIIEEYRNELYKLLEKELSPQQFKCISLYYGAGFEQNLIAQELGINKSNVNNYLKDAYNKILNSDIIKSFIKKFE